MRHVTCRQGSETTYLESPTLIFLLTIQLLWGSDEKSGYFLLRLLVLKAKSGENILSPNQNEPKFGFWDLGVRGLKSLVFAAKVTSLQESTSFKPFCVKTG